MNPEIEKMASVLSDVASKVSDGGRSVMDALNQNPALKRILGTALASGALGGTLTALSPKRTTESRKGRRNRILHNALMTATLGGGAMALGEYGGKSLANALPAGDVDPITEAATSGTMRAIGGGAGLGLAHAIPGRGVSTSQQNAAMSEFLASLKSTHSSNLTGNRSSFVKQLEDMTEGSSRVSEAEMRNFLASRFDGRLTGTANGPLEKMRIAAQDHARSVLKNDWERQLKMIGINPEVGTLNRMRGRAEILGHKFLSPRALHGAGWSPLARTAVGLGAGVAAPEIGNLVARMLGVPNSN